MLSILSIILASILCIGIFDVLYYITNVNVMIFDAFLSKRLRVAGNERSVTQTFKITTAVQVWLPV